VRQNPETFNRPLSYDLEPGLLHFRPNLGSAVKEGVSKVQNIVSWVPVLPCLNVRLQYGPERRVTQQVVTQGVDK
jgi:hypothetical protein